MWTIPNILTIARMAFLPALIGLFYMEPTWGAVAAWWAFGLYAVAAITDFLDGWIARKFNQITPFGTFLDPISDKVFVAAMLIILVGFDRLPGLWMLPVILILSREFLVSGLREFLGSKDVQMPVTQLAKWKTTVQMVATGLLIIGPYVPYGLVSGQILLLVAAIITVYTGWIYLRSGFKHINNT